MAYWGPSPRSPSMNPLCTSPSSLHTMGIRNANDSAYEHSFACDSAAAWHLSPSLEIPRETTYLNLVSSQQSAIRQTVRYLFPRAFTRPAGACFSKVPVSQRFGHPHSQIPSVLGIPFSYYCSVLGIPRYPPGMPKSLAFWSSPPKNAGFRGKIENVLDMASAKYRDLFQYLKKKAYREVLNKAKKKFAKKFEYDSKLESLFYVAKERFDDLLSARVFEEILCSFFWTRRPR